MGISRDIAHRGPECEPLPSAARVLAAFTRSRTRTREGESVSPMGPLEYQAERWRRIKVHQEGNQYLSDIIAFLKDDLERFSPKRLKKIAKVADLFALDVRGVLYRLARSTRGRPRDAGGELRLVVPESLREDMLHYAHEDSREDIRGSPILMKDCARSSTGPGYMFSGYVMCKPMASTTAQDVAEAYEESVFRRFGASSVIRHDQDPRFMSE
ncbi:Reverse transcriptase, partial [Phytophthora palmivora]